MNNNDNFVNDKRSLNNWSKDVNVLLLLTLIIFLFLIIYTIHLFITKPVNNI